MTRDEWIKEMGRLIKERDRATSMIRNWETKKQDAEAAIHELAIYAKQQAEQVPEHEPEHAQEYAHVTE